MPHVKLRLAFALLLVALGGCASNDRVSAGEAQVAGGHMTVKSGSTWKRLPARTSQTVWEEVYAERAAAR